MYKCSKHSHFVINASICGNSTRADSGYFCDAAPDQKKKQGKEDVRKIHVARKFFEAVGRQGSLFRKKHSIGEGEYQISGL